MGDDLTRIGTEIENAGYVSAREHLARFLHFATNPPVTLHEIADIYFDTHISAKEKRERLASLVDERFPRGTGGLIRVDDVYARPEDYFRVLVSHTASFLA